MFTFFKEATMESNRRDFLKLSGIVTASATVSLAIPNLAFSQEDYSTPRTLTRKQWSARPAEYDPHQVYYSNEEEIEYLVIHHTGSIPGIGTNPSIWQIQDAHMRKDNWIDVGYNEIHAKNAWCYLARDWQTMAAAVGPSVESLNEFKKYGYLPNPKKSLNYGTYNICLIGDFTFEEPENKQVDYLLERVKILAVKFPNITSEKVIGHKDNKKIADARGVHTSWRNITE